MLINVNQMVVIREWVINIEDSIFRFTIIISNFKSIYFPSI